MGLVIIGHRSSKSTLLDIEFPCEFVTEILLLCTPNLQSQTRKLIPELGLPGWAAFADLVIDV